MNTHLILVYRNGAKYEIPIYRIAQNRAQYISDKHKNTTYQEEYDFIMNDKYEARDWFLNSMDWQDIKDVVCEIQPPKVFDPSDFSNLKDSYFR